MNDFKRKFKQMFFGFIFVLITVGPMLFYYFGNFANSTCFNNRWDSGEDGIDCGGSCAECFTDLPPAGVSNFNQIRTVIIPIKGRSYDLVAEIENPNRDWGAEYLNYRFTLLDQNNEAIMFIDGADFIMPNNGSHKYIIKHIEDLQIKPNSAKLSLTKIKWKKFPLQLTKPDFIISYKSFKENNGVVVAEGEVRNASINGFNEIFINVVARNSSRQIVGAAKTDMSTLTSGEKRAFKIVWDNPFEERINENNIEWNVQVNILNEDNFMQKIYEPVEENR